MNTQNQTGREGIVGDTSGKDNLTGKSDLRWEITKQNEQGMKEFIKDAGRLVLKELDEPRNLEFTSELIYL